MMQKKYAKMLYPSPIGTLSLVADEQYLFGIWVQDQIHFERGIETDGIEIVKEHPVLDKVISYLDTYFEGSVQDLSDLSLAPIGTDFEKRVWDYLQAIPYAQTVTYGQIAQDLQVASAQAIGGAVGRNPWSILVPCHRVLGSGNRLTGYASGVEKKAWLLQHEGAAFQENKK
ncbi:methylated-DNA--[protein]-cysteine S-methyltransferase [Streptococcus oralis]|uniref:methylated-DNA--[protein]-cysteine S-methyltransferase n=1 Tax=Streptococcus oralis TaxID=1303 RepID=UPI0022851AAB|nr:methylated-DNA--[protein]-cysteine S-methyltransferase [Streptococcus oralis]MCY7100877.1 methylated-DNA--[protein]-cysteine S-methyltransferase [Streptococcus oralis]